MPKFCTECGYSFPGMEKFCPDCGTKRNWYRKKYIYFSNINQRNLICWDPGIH
jgi:predicted  nucleic acid-binding Zn-ribbon protein